MILLMGALLVPGKRTVMAALRITGCRTASHFTHYHQVALERTRHHSPAFDAGVRDTVERRWARVLPPAHLLGPCPSSHAQFREDQRPALAEVHGGVPVAGAGRVKALPFLTVLAPSERCNRGHGRPHKRQTD
ncbi:MULTISPECIES: hypothetical protein [unclassified Mesorhizobium]|uniref:hypothetical protein n=1 Tax=unclassified Mesorhizobium TaxID=325217 RepID=UPI0012EBFAAB|nr:MULTISPECIES: hypothetical protein [unclassified Mesorhizobium]WJI81097.1 hypothetical protein NLY34_31150 [Mesorhizobium sp. C374B]WJI87638.1 hypothetical protein NLY42_01885 [Mesorhizobium sp. C372A]